MQFKIYIELIFAEQRESWEGNFLKYFNRKCKTNKDIF